MTFRVLESRVGRRVERRIEVRLMIFPGAPMRRGPERPRNEPEGEKTAPGTTLRPEQLSTVVSLYRRQAQVWIPFALEADRGRTVSYRFDFRVRESDDKTPVMRWENTVDGLFEVEAEGARGYASVFREAQSFAFDNVAVVHPSLDRDPCTIRLDGGGRLTNPGWRVR